MIGERRHLLLACAGILGAFANAGKAMGQAPQAPAPPGEQVTQERAGIRASVTALHHDQQSAILAIQVDIRNISSASLFLGVSTWDIEGWGNDGSELRQRLVRGLPVCEQDWQNCSRQVQAGSLLLLELPPGDDTNLLIHLSTRTRSLHTVARLQLPIIMIPGGQARPAPQRVMLNFRNLKLG